MLADAVLQRRPGPAVEGQTGGELDDGGQGGFEPVGGMTEGLPPHQRHERQGEDRGKEQPAQLPLRLAPLFLRVAGEQRRKTGVFDRGKDCLAVELLRVEANRCGFGGEIHLGDSHPGKRVQLLLERLRTVGAVHAAKVERQLRVGSGFALSLHLAKDFG